MLQFLFTLFSLPKMHSSTTVLCLIWCYDESGVMMEVGIQSFKSSVFTVIKGERIYFNMNFVLADFNHSYK